MSFSLSPFVFSYDTLLLSERYVCLVTLIQVCLCTYPCDEQSIFTIKFLLMFVFCLLLLRFLLLLLLCLLLMPQFAVQPKWRQRYAPRNGK